MTSGADVLERHGTPTVSTYHAFAGTLIAEHGLRLGIEPDLRIPSDASRFQRAFRAIASSPGPLADATTSMPDLVGHVLALDGQLSEHLVTPDELRAFDVELRVDVERAIAEAKHLKLARRPHRDARRRDELVSLVDRYREAKAEAGVIDFSDQMAWGAVSPECPEVARSRASASTSCCSTSTRTPRSPSATCSRAVLRRTGRRPRPLRHRGRRPGQGIYGWRGAAAGNLTEFLDDFPADPARAARGSLFHLRVNRRCRAEIIDVANRVAAPYYRVTEVVRPLLPADGTDGGTVRVAVHQTVVDEIGWLVDEVVAAHDGRDGEPTPWSEIAILVRTRRRSRRWSPRSAAAESRSRSSALPVC